MGQLSSSTDLTFAVNVSHLATQHVTHNRPPLIHVRVITKKRRINLIVQNTSIIHRLTFGQAALHLSTKELQKAKENKNLWLGYTIS